MQLFKHRVPANDAEIFDACTGRRALRDENYSEGVLLAGLPLYLDEPGRAYYWTPLASVLSRERSRTRLKLSSSVLADSLAAADTPVRAPVVILSEAKNLSSFVQNRVSPIAIK